MATSLDALDPAIRDAARELVAVAGQAGLQPRVTSTLRTRSEQTRLYRRFLAGQSAYPVAPPGTSAHEFGAAFDMVTAGMQSLDELGALWESWGGVWGGRFGDEIHFEAPGFSHAPARQQNVIDRFFSAIDSLPWYVQALIPIQLSFQKLDREATYRATPQWIKDLIQ